MANRIKGITVEIGGDTTNLQTALKGVNSEIKTTQSQLKDVEKLLKLDPSNTELLNQKYKLLGQAVDETKQKLETLKTAQQQANEAPMVCSYTKNLPTPCLTVPDSQTTATDHRVKMFYAQVLYGCAKKKQKESYTC